MKPYYDHAGVTIYHGDCRGVLLDVCVDLVLTDPPYGVHCCEIRNGFMADRAGQDAANWDVAPSPETFQMVLAAAPLSVIWGFGYFAHILGRCVAPLVWDKETGANYFADGELAWTSFPQGTLRIFHHQWCGAFKASERHVRSEHPTQKPTALMRWSISQAQKHGQCQEIADPFMGSGTTLIAAKQLGLRAIGIEIEERYCEIAAQRLSQEVFDFSEAIPSSVKTSRGGLLLQSEAE